MELRHLRYFVAVAEEQHVTRAAKRLGIQQPPLSQQIRSLEEELDVQLLRRKPRGVELTEAGHAFFNDARAILAQAEKAKAKAKQTARGEQGKIVVGFTTSAPLNPFITSVIRFYRDAYPNVSLVLEEGNTGTLVDAIGSEHVDVAFIRSRVTDREGLATHTLLKEEMVAALPAKHTLARGGSQDTGALLSLSELASEPFILYRRNAVPGLYDTIISGCERAGFNPQIAQEAPQIISTLNLVAAGLGVTIVPASLRNLAMPGIVFRALKSKPRLIAPINLACRAVDHSAPARNFAQLVRKRAKETL